MQNNKKKSHLRFDKENQSGVYKSFVSFVSKTKIRESLKDRVCFCFNIDITIMELSPREKKKVSIFNCCLRLLNRGIIGQADVFYKKTSQDDGT